MQKIKKLALPMQKIIKIGLCKNFEKFALPLQKIKKTCIANAKNNENLHCRSKKIKVCIANAKNEKNCIANAKYQKKICQCKK